MHWGIYCPPTLTQMINRFGMILNACLNRKRHNNSMSLKVCVCVLPASDMLSMTGRITTLPASCLYRPLRAV